MKDPLATVLYVEDEDTDIFFMQRAFEKTQAPAILRTLGTGQDAVDYFYAGQAFAKTCPKPGLVLLDLNLPVLSGFDVLSWIRQQQHLDDLPVIVFTSSTHPADRATASRLGATDYWVKPSSVAALEDLVRTLCRRYFCPPCAPPRSAAEAQAFA